LPEELGDVVGAGTAPLPPSAWPPPWPAAPFP
jgi:hypothetical protein